MWAVPRSVSTAFERAMRARGDLIVFSEPFSAPYYLSEERVSDRFAGPGTRTPGAEWRKVVQDILARTEEGTVFVKDMAYHASPCLDSEFVRNFQNTFILRHPGLTLPSLKRLMPDFTPEEAGFAAQLRLMNLALEASDDELIVVDAEELRRSPAAVIEDYCRRVDLPHRPESLTWESGLLSDWRRWEEWHGDVAASTEITPPPADPEPARPEAVDPAVYVSCLEDYERMVALTRAGRSR